MKKRIKKWTFRLAFSGVFIFGLLIIIALNPILLYAHKTVENNYTIYHQQPLDPAFAARLNSANDLVKSSELYDGSLKLSVCLNDGSYYPNLIRMCQGNAFGWGFGRIITLGGNTNATENYEELNGYKWNLTRLVAHEATHCLQFHKYGLRGSNPIAGIPGWKWEGYAEYVARNNDGDLKGNIARLLAAEKADNNGWMDFKDGTGEVIQYYRSMVLVRFCLEVKGMSYDQLLKDTASERRVRVEMMAWYAADR